MCPKTFEQERVNVVPSFSLPSRSLREEDGPRRIGLNMILFRNVILTLGMKASAAAGEDLKAGAYKSVVHSNDLAQNGSE
mgnify:CR=1 FL=1